MPPKPRRRAKNGPGQQLPRRVELLSKMPFRGGTHDFQYEEGASKYISQDSYERNPQARAECIKLYGRNCAVCNLNFESVYGDIGSKFIHVHHLTSLKSRGGKSYHVNPKTDLRPVCPNCHAMLHQQEPPLTIKALQKRMSAQR